MPVRPVIGPVIGIDIGTQSLKAIVVHFGGERPDGARSAVLGQASLGYGVSHPRPGWAEQDPRLWESALSRVIGEALRAARVEPSAVRGLAVAGQLDGCVAVGASGEPLSPCLIWMDRRAVGEVEEAGLKVPALRLQAKTGIMADASHMAAKIAWLKKQGGLAGARCFHQPTSYLVSRLTGRHVFDHGLASTTMLYRLETRDYDGELLAAFGISRAELPEIADATAVAGPLSEQGARLTGLPVGLPVAVGTGDDFSAPLGAGLAQPGRMVGILGTAEVVGALSREACVDARGLVETHRFIDGSYFIENPGWLSGGAITWFLSTFRVSGGVDELNELAARAPAGCDGLLFLPALSGAMAPEWNAGARGCFYGLTPAHGLGHMARALLEGCAFAMRDVLERLREMQVPIESILLSGGGARSQLWAQIRADVCQAPVYISESTDTSPVGAAILAAVACGVAPTVAACAPWVGRTSSVYQPVHDHAALYDQAHSRYRRLFESLKPLY
jgi:xylulokinase